MKSAARETTPQEAGPVPEWSGRPLEPDRWVGDEVELAPRTRFAVVVAVSVVAGSCMWALGAYLVYRLVA